VNKLYYGDCLTIMQEMRLSSIDLIYLDPPWNSNRAYNAIYRDSTGLELPDQVEAFCDIWELTPERESVIRNMPVLMAQAGIEDSAGKLWQLWMSALRHTQPKLLAYLLYMTERLIVMKGLLKPTGSIYLHCDPTASHYIKSLMDAILGSKNFQNEIIWCYKRYTAAANRYQRLHDTILFYSKGETRTFNSARSEYGEQSGKHDSHYKQDEDGRWYRWQKRKGLDPYKIYLSKGVRLGDWWEIPPINASAHERLGYPTQKPLTLLKRIIEISSNVGDVVFDPFCGCATTICAAHELNRKWIGIDIAYHAIKRVAQVRLQDEYGLIEGVNYTVSGVPRTLEGAQNLWQQDKYGFQRWAVEQVNGFVTTKRTADGGIDGRLWFALPGEKKLRSMVIEVKGGKNVGINVVRALRGALEHDEADMAGLIIMDPLPDRQRQNFMKEMNAGMLDVMGVQYPRMQILSVPEILDKRMFLTPSVAGRGTGQGNLPLQDTR
jgi:site-specific DNA-methyltransferase (adenine-specific)